MKNLIVFTAVLALTLLGSAGIANAGSWNTSSTGKITTNDNVGIGSTTPGGLLEIKGAGSKFGMLRIMTTGGAFAIGAEDTTVDPVWRIHSNARESIVFAPGSPTDANANTLFLDGVTLNVGIGTRNPAAKLDVDGDILATDDGDTLTTDDDTMVSVVDLSRRIAALEAIVKDLPPGLLNQKDRNADNK